MSDKVECEEVTEELAKYLKSNCTRLPTGEVRVDGCVLPRTFNQFTQQLIDLEVRSDDTWILSYPKCGTTWTQEMVWLLANNCDFDTAKKVKLEFRCPFLEYTAIGGFIGTNSITEVNNMPSPRFIKCHLPFHLLPKELWNKKPKMVYVYRDARDVAISYYHHMRLWYDYSGTKDKLVDAFLEELLPYDPYWKHVIKFWELKDEPYFCFNTFEEMKEDLGSVIDKTAKFLGVAISEENRANLIEHLSFNSMQKNVSVNYSSDLSSSKFPGVQFIREGKSGGWKSQLSSQQVDRFDSIAKKYIQNTDFPFYKIN